MLDVNRVLIDCAMSGSNEYMLLIIWAKNGDFFQKGTEKPLTAWTKSRCMAVGGRSIEIEAGIDLSDIYICYDCYDLLPQNWTRFHSYVNFLNLFAYIRDIQLEQCEEAYWNNYICWYRCMAILSTDLFYPRLSFLRLTLGLKAKA